MDHKSPRRAILSVYDKRGLVDFARGLTDLDFEIVSTGGTYRTLTEAGLKPTYVSEVTGFPEILGGRVKTLHPRVHAGILARPTLDADRAELAEQEIGLIQVVAVNLYPFAETIRQADVSLEDALENIDIGGPAMIRAAAKNFPHVIPIVNPDRYPDVLRALGGGAGELSLEMRRVLATEAYAHTSTYDATVATYLGGSDLPSADNLPAPRPDPNGAPPTFPDTLHLRLVKSQDLRYGENPHQAAAFYRQEPPAPGSLAAARQLQGKELSFNNIYDTGSALQMVREFNVPAVVAVKHTNPCGLALGTTIEQAFQRAQAADPVSIFGGIVACNRQVDGPAARLMAAIFLEVVAAPAFTDEALQVLGGKANLRVLQVPGLDGMPAAWWDLKRVEGGLLVQEGDVFDPEQGEWRVVTRREPAAAEWDDLLFGWKVVKHVKSNGVVVARDGGTLGVGAGQMNRILPARLALQQAGAGAKGAVLASEAFFPFPDVVEAAAAAGISAIVQPGGAKRDSESVEAADAAGIAMVFTGVRHFKH